MRYFILLLLLAPVLFTPVHGFAGELATDLDTSTAQVPLSGKVKSSPIPKEFFFEKEKGMVSEGAILAAGYLEYNDHPFGYIAGMREEKSIANPGDIVFIDRGTKAGVASGQRYYVYKKSREVQDPKSGEKAGYIVQVVGLIEIDEVKEEAATATVVKSYNAIFKGHSLMPEFKVIPPRIDPDRPVENKSLASTIFAVNDDKGEFTAGEIVYIGIGHEDGVEEGDVFTVTEAKGSYYDAPPGTEEMGKTVGKAQVILARKYSATAIITRSAYEVRVGDRVSFIQER